MILYLVISNNNILVNITTEYPENIFPQDQVWFVDTDCADNYSLDIDDILRGDSPWRPYDGELYVEDFGHFEVYREGKLTNVIEND